MKLMMPPIIKVLVVSWLLALAACGGSGNSGTAPAPVISAEGLWTGSTSTARTVTGIVLDNGTYWLLYSQPNVSALTAGFVQGTGTSLNGSFSSSDGIDFNISGQGINNATVSASYATSQSFNGSVTYPNLNSTYTFTSAYNADYDKTPSLSAIAGNYVGIASVAGSNEALTMVINPQGLIAGTGTSNCQYAGLVVPRAKGNLYDLSLVISGSNCATGTSSVTGIGYFDSGAKRLYLAALNSARSNGLVFDGIKP